jgi:protein SCO1/2
MLTIAEVKRLLGKDGDKLQALFITVDPERDTLPLLKAYMANFDPTFLALRPEPSALKSVADSFKVTFRRAEGPTPTSSTVDHSAGKYIFDTNGAVRLYAAYGSEASLLAEDIGKLLKSTAS